MKYVKLKDRSASELAEHAEKYRKLHERKEAANAAFYIIREARKYHGTVNIETKEGSAIEHVRGSITQGVPDSGQVPCTSGA